MDFYFEARPALGRDGAILFFPEAGFLDLTAGLAAAARTGSPAGSPVAAFSTFPPPDRAMSAKSLLLATERAFSAAMSSVEANSSRCLINSHDLPGSALESCHADFP
jgi:hypothetical protein